MIEVSIMAGVTHVATIKLPALPRKGDYIISQGREYKVDFVIFRADSHEIEVNTKRVV